VSLICFISIYLLSRLQLFQGVASLIVHKDVQSRNPTISHKDENIQRKKSNFKLQMIRMKKFLLLCSYTVFSLQLFAQFSFVYSDDIIVKRGSDTLDFAWTGGLSYSQLADIDIDFDGDLDLFIFDRSSDNIRVFTQENDNGNKYYKFKYDGASLFPNDIYYRATTADYDNDGRKDIFCYGIGGIKVYRNVGDATNGLQWELAKNLLYSDNWGTELNLYVSSADIPAIVDVEGDGDLDVLTYHIGGQHLQYHKNMSMETYGIPDSLIFELRNECWGTYREDINTNTVFLNDNTPPCAEGNVPGAESNIPDDVLKSKPSEQTQKHSGSTVLALDIDNSGVLDLVLGDVAFNNLVLLTNGGVSPNTNSAMISADPSFPSNTTPVNIEVFPAAFFVDVDFDNVKDLVVGTNAKNISENEKSILYYKNTGSNNAPNFIFQTNEFLQKEMIEHGTGGTPVFCDIDNDGDQDLFVGNFFRHLPGLLKESTIAFYLNTGTSTNPVYTFVDYNFANLNSFSLGLKMTPTFGDLNGDGKKDMIIGREDGTLAYFQNIGIPPAINFAAPVLNYQDGSGTTISAGQYAAPQLFDLDNDGLLDLIIGKKTGELIYYRNEGTTAAPSFVLTNSMLGNIDIATVTPDGYPVPHFFRHNNVTSLFLGAYDGKLRYYNNIDGNLASGNTFFLVSDNFLGFSSGAYSSFAVNDLDGDGNLNMIAGHDLGGLLHFEVDPNSNIGLQEISVEFDFSVFPNPGNGLFTLMTEEAGSKNIQLCDLTGAILYSESFEGHKISLDLQMLPKGIYMLMMNDEKGSFKSKKIIIQ